MQDLATLTFVGSALGSTALANATWYTVRLAYDRAAGGVLRVWLDASLEISITHTAAGTAVDQIQVLAAAAAYNYDDFYLTDTATQPPLGQIVRIAVNGPGYRSDFDTVVAATNRETNVDDLTPSDADYNGHAAATLATDLYALQSSPVGTINAVKGMWRMRGSAVAVGGTHDYAWRVQGIEASQAFTGLGAAWTQTEVVWSTPPGVGGTWTQAEVDGLELGAQAQRHARGGHLHLMDRGHGRLRCQRGRGSRSPAAGGPQALVQPQLAYRKAILVDHTKVVGDLVDFPVLISRSGDADLAAHARADGFDILFTDEDGTTKLSHQREAYDGAGNLVAWVKVPLLPTGADKTIFMYYDNPLSPDQQSVNATWTNGYRAVWHLSEASGAGAYIRNSALNDYHGTPTEHGVQRLRQDRRRADLLERRLLEYRPRQQRRPLQRLEPVLLRVLDLSRLRLGCDLAGRRRRRVPVRQRRPRAAGTRETITGDPAGTGELQIDVQFNTAGTQFVRRQHQPAVRGTTSSTPTRGRTTRSSSTAWRCTETFSRTTA